jgi:transposase
MRRRHELYDEEWERLRPLLPPEVGRAGCQPKPHRRMINAMLWVLRTGGPWRDLPEHYGPWNTVYTRFYRWAKSGLWQRIFDQLASSRDEEGYMLDATIIKAHQDAGGAQKKKDLNVLELPEGASLPRSTPSSTRSVTRIASRSQKGKRTT